MSLFEILIVFLIMSTIFAVYTKARSIKAYRLVKPLPVLMLCLMVILHIHLKNSAGYFPYGIGCGLACGFVGDIFLLMKKKLFVFGLFSFFIGHIFYLSAFLSKITVINFWILFLLVPAIIYYILLSRRMNRFGSKQHNAISLYAVTILLMCLSSFSFEFSAGSAIPVYGIGTILFIISDSGLAWSIFVKERVFLHVVFLVAYYAAQIIIAGRTIYLMTSGVI